MDLSLKVFVVALLLLVATEEQGGGSVQVALARECRSQSHKFHGACIHDTNCASVCLSEGYTGGKCVGARHRCFCTKEC